MVFGKSNIKELNLSEIYVSGANPRLTRKRELVKEMAATLVSQGQQYPIKVVDDPRNGKKYGCYDGAYRLEAAKLAGMEKIRAEIKKGLSPADMTMEALVAGTEVVPLSPVEEGAAFAKILKEREITEAELAAKIGRNAKYVRGRIDLAKLPRGVQEGVALGEIPLWVAERLVREGPTIAEHAAKLIKPGAPRVDIEEAIRRVKGGKSPRIPLLAVQFESFDEKRKVERAAKERKISSSKYIYELVKTHKDSPI